MLFHRGIGFPSDELVAELNAQAVEQKAAKENFKRREAAKGENGRYIKVEPTDWGPL
jgi:hypothetical protein